MESRLEKMDSKHCMNVACGASSVSMQWCKGWVLQSGNFAILCDQCGFLYEQSRFCDVFHSIEPGWRQCNCCGKYLHCGCIVSQYLYELHDTNGVRCANCARKARHQHVAPQTLSLVEKHGGSIGASRIENENEIQRANQVVEDHAENEGMRSKPGPDVPYIQQLESSLASHFHSGSSSSSLSSTLGAAPLGNSSIPSHNAAAVVDEREQILQGPEFRPVSPMIPLSASDSGLEADNARSEIRTSAAMALPRIHGMHQQLLGRYSPKITDQELQQLSEISNSIVVPLFEKELSASDVGPVGRLIIPKPCAEVFFPPISEPKGIPLEIYDVNRNIWKMKFRFWPTNGNSRLYVLEGVRPFIKAMQLKAGDTATFNRVDPEGKLLIGIPKQPLPPQPSPSPPLLPAPPSAAQVAPQTLSLPEKHGGSIGASRIENENEIQRANQEVEDHAENEGMRSKPGPNVPYIQQLESSLASHFHSGSSSSSLSSTLGAAPLGNSSIPSHNAAAVVDEREQILQGPEFRPVSPMIPLSASDSGLEANNASTKLRTSAAIALPRILGMDKELLGCYSPKITDQELQQLSENSNSIVLPLFEKELSASDVGPVGRLIIPKPCAEVFFPPISEPKGIPLEIYDVNRNIWKMQFRFWPANGNSRLYFLEGVQPFIQAMQLKVGDTATFNRMDPEGKLIIGFRKQPLPSAAQTADGLVLPQEAAPKKKRPRKSMRSFKTRLCLGSQSILEVARHNLKKTPIFVNGSIYITSSNRNKERWTQCDSCSKWRKIPVDIVLYHKWTCADNVWDQSRSSCSAPNELIPVELEELMNMSNTHDSAILEDNSGDYTSKRRVSTITRKRRKNRQPSRIAKHGVTCICNDCMIVKNQKWLKMMQDMNLQSERETGVRKLNLLSGRTSDGSQVETSSHASTTTLDSVKRKVGSRVEFDLNRLELDLNRLPDFEDI